MNNFERLQNYQMEIDIEQANQMGFEKIEFNIGYCGEKSLNVYSKIFIDYLILKYLSMSDYYCSLIC